jgi:hypothetical protein
MGFDLASIRIEPIGEHNKILFQSKHEYIHVTSTTSTEGLQLNVYSDYRVFHWHQLFIFTVVGFAIGVAAAHFS